MFDLCSHYKDMQQLTDLPALSLGYTTQQTGNVSKLLLEHNQGGGGGEGDAEL